MAFQTARELEFEQGCRRRGRGELAITDDFVNSYRNRTEGRKNA